MRPTIRGSAAITVLAASFAMAWEYGPQTLNAVVTPLLVAVVVGLVSIGWTSRPEVDRIPVSAGFVGERRTVEVEFGPGSTALATVRDTVGDGLSAVTVESGDGGEEPVAEINLAGDDRFDYEIRLEERGDHRIGPLTVTVTDVLGLFERTFTYEETTSVLVYPPVHDLWGGTGSELAQFIDEGRRTREEFDHLREYRQGDALRDVHWKSAAKRPDADLVVTEYATAEETGSAVVAAEAVPGRADELATAVASVATYLLEAGVDVGVDLPREGRPPGRGRDHHRELLGLFAVLDAGELEEERRRRADVLVRADADGTTVVVDDRTIPFARLVDRTEPDHRSGTDARNDVDDAGSEAAA